METETGVRGSRVPARSVTWCDYEAMDEEDSSGLCERNQPGPASHIKTPRVLGGVKLVSGLAILVVLLSVDASERHPCLVP